MTEPTSGPAMQFKPVEGEAAAGDQPTAVNPAHAYPAQPSAASGEVTATPSASSAARASAASGPRRVRLVLSRVDPWSVMKLSFLLSIAVGIAIVTATWVIWTVLNSMGVFASVISIIEEIDAMNQFGPLLEYLELSRVLSAATVFAVVDIVLMTVISTLGAFIYNLVAAMIGGLHVTFTDE